MSLRDSIRAKKASAFSVFKTKKDLPVKENGNAKDLDAFTTPSAPPAKLDHKEMLKAEKKKIKSAQKKPKRPILPGKDLLMTLPEGTPGLRNDSGVQLKSMKSKGSFANLKESRAVLNGRSSTSSVSSGMTVIKPKKQSPKAEKKLSPKMKKKKSLSETRSETPERPAKRRKVSASNLDKSVPDSVATVDEMTPHPHKGIKRSTPYMYDSTEEAKRLFECLLHPVKPAKFFSELWESKPLLVKRHMPSYNDGWFSTEEFDKILREHELEFSVNVDITSYENGTRETHNPPGRAYAPVVWDFYQSGCSVRLLNPQTYSRNVWKFLSTLQEYFGSCVGANVYLTPPGTQGFAPHYDDIEAFILQLEGKKHWRMYSPRNEAETLPRFSSGNFRPEDDIGEPILDVVLEAGDLLYFPRGFIHQGDTPEDAHSLHITVSCHQKNTWGDLLQQLVPQALAVAMEEDVDMRRGLPTDYLQYMGVANSDSDNPQRKSFLRHIEQLMTKLLAYAPVDAAADQMGKKFIYDTLPPVLTRDEKSCSVHGTGERWDAKEKRVVGVVEIEPDTAIKIMRRGVIRLVMEEEQVRVYHSLENARVYHGSEEKFIEIGAEAAPAVEFLIHAYPEYVSVESLPLETLQEKIEIATALYDRGLVITGEPLVPVGDGPTSSEDEDE